MRIFLVILAALIVAGGTGFYVLQGLQPPSAPTAQAEAPRLREVYVAARELATGTLIAPMHLTRMQITDSAITPEMIVADSEGEGVLVGSVARQVLPQGVPIARSATVRPGDRGFLAAVLPKGKRAITIPVSATAGLYGLAIPGDWVDLILTYSVAADDDGENSAGAKPRDIHASETVAHNIRLLAFDARVGPVELNDKGEKVTPPAPTTATLQVSPEEAQAITLATTLGTLSLALNSVRDGGEGAEPATSPLERTSLRTRAAARVLSMDDVDMTLDSDVTSLLRLEVQKNVPEQVTRIQVVRGTARGGLIDIRPSADAAAAAASQGAATPAE